MKFATFVLTGLSILLTGCCMPETKISTIKGKQCVEYNHGKPLTCRIESKRCTLPCTRYEEFTVMLPYSDYSHCA